ncbi:alpha/beta fold hydrolase [Falsiroseomonas tokyonensis]|uniref:Alpha/beta fold hydrolase n=1 Tax=Falsiroseomonas tokyonensis TaxID=430521 RepID=A0ABV7C022_9PROT|nr:alpha/beta hydrolase [Falsiroseomonas tokyonensis]MBU8540265.1 alpha/beta hydrolase [Falsiroseomonas tokyonensis]
MRRGRLRYLLGAAFHQMAWTEWGPPEGSPVICVHGLTRNGRDFDVLAQALAGQGRRVFCPDLPGRGASDWLPDPRAYAPPSYVMALAHLLARLEGPVDWVGTSLGGICGMLLAAAQGTPIRRLVLNDVGSQVPAAALQRITAYLAEAPGPSDLAGIEAYLRRVHAPFGPLTDAQWRHMAETSTRALPDGRLALHHDPAIALPLAEAEKGAPSGPIDLRPIWQAVRQPVLILRGAESDVLEEATAAAMAQRPGVELATLPGIGHAPALMAPDQVARILAFLG